MSGGINDVLVQLLSYQWRGVEFPCENFSIELSQDQVEHKWPDRDGAHVEATGRNPLVFRAKALFYNGVRPGPTEHLFQVLYPTQFRAFLDACADRSVGTLQHPELGQIQAKCKSASVHWDSHRRDGVTVDAIWVEHTGTADVALAQESPVQNASAIAAGLDADLADFHISHPEAEPTISFLGAISALLNFATAVADSISLYVKQIAGKIDAISYKLDSLLSQLDKIQDPQTWPVRQSANRMIDALNHLGDTLLNSTVPIAVYYTPKDMTLAALATTLKSSISQLQSLNPRLVALPVVPALSPVRHYMVP